VQELRTFLGAVDELRIVVDPHHVVPDLLQFIALRARLENLDGVPIISLNDVPLRGLNSVLKRAIDVAISATALVGLGVPLAIIALLIFILGAVRGRGTRL